MASDHSEIPLIDVGPLVEAAPVSSGAFRGVVSAIGRACRDHGFFYVVGHGVEPALLDALEASSREFFAWDEEAKLAVRMERGGRAWRGYFPLGGELTSGRPDWKEGLYFGSELGPEHPKVAGRVPLHGPNLFPPLPGLRTAVLAYLEAMTSLGHTLMRGIAASLGLPPDYFADRYTGDPLILFRIFNYPALPESPDGASAVDRPWSVGEHTDYGLLTILLQDGAGGLQVRTPSGWIEAPPVPGSLVCNIGDMLDRMTGGLYHSTPHRVRNASRRDRLSFPFFFDPNFDAEVQPIRAGMPVRDDRDERWDRASVHEFGGTYGEYLIAKVSKVFPRLWDERDDRRT